MENTVPREYTLSDGTKMPSIGLGTAKFKDKNAMVTGIMLAGYCHLDTAHIYGNEEIVGEALEECFKQGKKREEIYITTKIWHDQYHDVDAAIKQSLRKLKLDYVDMYLIHWPASYASKKPLHVLWPEMETLVAKGFVKSIGVSNFNT